MGTDIHGRLEYRFDANRNYRDVGEIENDRSYNVFAMLAGVRNGSGFGGCATHDPITPISSPRGLPNDFITPMIHDGHGKKVDEYWMGEHSFSWVSLREVIDWLANSGDVLHYGVLDRAEYERMLREGDTPQSWCGDVGGGGVIKVDAKDADGVGNYTHVRYSWMAPFISTDCTFRKWIEYLTTKYAWELATDPAAVRLVFGFDS